MASSPLESCLALWYRLNSFRIFAEPSAIVLPATAVVYATLISLPQGLRSSRLLSVHVISYMCLFAFLNLKIAPNFFVLCFEVMAMKEKKGGWNISHGPVGPVCAFNHNPYNEVVEDVWYQQLYPLPLSRYNHQVSGNVAELFVINLASEPPMGPSSPKAAAPQEYDATLHPITTSSLLPSIAVSIWVEYSFGPSGVRLSPLSQKGGSHNNMTFQAGYGRQLIRYLKSPIQPDERGRTVKIKTCLLIEEIANGNDDRAARIDISVSEISTTFHDE
eukprot:360737_1